MFLFSYLASSPALRSILPTLSPVGSWKLTATVSIHALSVFLYDNESILSANQRDCQPVLRIRIRIISLDPDLYQKLGWIRIRISTSNDTDPDPIKTNEYRK